MYKVVQRAHRHGKKRLTMPLLLESIDAVGGEVFMKKYGVYRSVMVCYARFREAVFSLMELAGCARHETPQDFAGTIFEVLVQV